MKGLRIILLVIMLAFFVVVAISQFKNSYVFSYQLAINGPSSKVFPYVASHEWKHHMFANIKAEGSSIKPFIVGNESVIQYGKKSEKQVIEKVVSMDSPLYLKLAQEYKDWSSVADYHFTEKNITVDLEIKDSVYIKSPFLRPLVFLNPNSFYMVREQYYQELKQYIESTPDYNLEPSNK